MRRLFVICAFLTAASLAATPLSAQEEEAKEESSKETSEEETCRVWTFELRNSEDYDLGVYRFLGDEVPKKVRDTDRSRLRGPFIGRIDAESSGRFDLAPGIEIVWLESFAPPASMRDLGWSDPGVIVVSPDERTSSRNVRIRPRFRCKESVDSAGGAG